MIRPKPRSRMPSMTLRQVLKALDRSVAITASQSPGSILCNGLSRVMPALLTRMSIGPISASILAMPSLQASKSPTSNL